MESNLYERASQGDAEAQYELGNKYYYEEDEGEEAVEWYRKAAEQGNTDAMLCLGLCYAQGKGVPQDLAEAVRLYRKAAEYGNATAQFCFGNCYLYGTGVPNDYEEAVSWFRKAAKQDYGGAQYNLGVCYNNGIGVLQDSDKANYWFRKAEENGAQLSHEDFCHHSKFDIYPYFPETSGTFVISEKFATYLKVSIVVVALIILYIYLEQRFNAF